MIIQRKNKNEIPQKPIKCPRCKSKDITLLTEYHKSLICRILKTIFLAIITIIILTNIKNIFLENNISLTPLPFILIFAYIITEIAQQYIESKTNIQCVCKDCGFFWLHND